jgi:hypothetical protein
MMKNERIKYVKDRQNLTPKRGQKEEQTAMISSKSAPKTHRSQPPGLPCCCRQTALKQQSKHQNPP